MGQLLDVVGEGFADLLVDEVDYFIDGFIDLGVDEIHVAVYAGGNGLYFIVG